MADLGVKNITYRKISFAALRIPWWKGFSNSPSTFGPATGRFIGQVTENSVPVPLCVVRLYYRTTGALIASTFADATGLFSFVDLPPADTGEFFIVAFDPDGGVMYNAIIFDRLTPEV